MLAGVLLSACQPVIQTLTPPPPPEIWQVQVTPTLRWLGPIFQQCAAGLPGANLLVSERPASLLDPQKADFAFQWGERQNPAAFTAVVGQDNLVVVVNHGNPIETVTIEEARGLFDGTINQWETLDNNSKDFSGIVQAYVYATGDDVQTAAGWISSGPAAILAPDPAAVRSTVAAERYSISYIPERWLDASVKALVIEGSEPGQLRRPLLAMSAQEPQGTRRIWLMCVQDKLK